MGRLHPNVLGLLFESMKCCKKSVAMLHGGLLDSPDDAGIMGEDEDVAEDTASAGPLGGSRLHDAGVEVDQSSHHVLESPGRKPSSTAAHRHKNTSYL